MSNSDTAVQNNRVQIPGSELSMPAPPPEAHWTVYKITGPDGKVYIGQTGEPLQVRWSKGYHLSYKTGRGAIREAMQKLGKENFRIEPLCENLTREGAWELEAKFIELYDSLNPEKGYNGKTGPEYRKSLSEGGLRSYAKNPERRKNKSELMKRLCAEGKNDCFIYSDNRPRPVMCVETGVVYSSLREAARVTGINNISAACKGIYIHAGGYHWKFVNENGDGEPIP